MGCVEAKIGPVNSTTIQEDNLSCNHDQDGLLVPILVMLSVCLLVCVFLCIFFIFLEKKINDNIKLESVSVAKTRKSVEIHFEKELDRVTREKERMEIDFDHRVQRSLADKEKAENDLKSSEIHFEKELDKVTREKERMEIEFDQRVQRSLADKEKAENDLKSNLEQSLKVLNLKADDDDAKKRYIDELKKEVEDMSVEMNHMRVAHAKELVEIEDRLKTEYEEKIKRMQEERELDLKQSHKDSKLKTDDDDAKNKYIDELKEEVEEMSVEMNHLRVAHAKELVEIEDRLKTEYEEKIKRMRKERAHEEMRLKQAVADNITEDTLNHHLRMERDRLERELDREVRDHQREKAAMERDIEQRIFLLKLQHKKELRTGHRTEVQSKMESPAVSGEI